MAIGTGERDGRRPGDVDGRRGSRPQIPRMDGISRQVADCTGPIIVDKEDGKGQVIGRRGSRAFGVVGVSMRGTGAQVCGWVNRFGDDERDVKPGIGLPLIACLLELDWLIQLVEYKFFFFPFTYGYYFDIR